MTFLQKENTVQFHKSCKKEEIMPENRFPAWNQANTHSHTSKQAVNNAMISEKSAPQQQIGTTVYDFRNSIITGIKNDGQV